MYMYTAKRECGLFISTTTHPCLPRPTLRPLFLLLCVLLLTKSPELSPILGALFEQAKINCRWVKIASWVVAVFSLLFTNLSTSSTRTCLRNKATGTCMLACLQPVRVYHKSPPGWKLCSGVFHSSHKVKSFPNTFSSISF